VAFEIPKQHYSGKIGETTLGTGSGAVELGGETSYPFHLFEGDMPNPTKIAMEVLGLPITNTTMLGSLIKASGIIDRESVIEPLRKRFGRIADKNISAYQRAFEETEVA